MAGDFVPIVSATAGGVKCAGGAENLTPGASVLYWRQDRRCIVRKEDVTAVTGKEWLILTIVLALAAGVGVPLAGSFLRARDFKAQVSGKKPTRKIDGEQIPDTAAQAPDRTRLELESLKTVAEMKSRHVGPK